MEGLSRAIISIFLGFPYVSKSDLRAKSPTVGYGDVNE